MSRESKYSIEKRVQLIFSYLHVTLRDIKGLKNKNWLYISKNKKNKVKNKIKSLCKMNGKSKIKHKNM